MLIHNSYFHFLRFCLPPAHPPPSPRLSTGAIEEFKRNHSCRCCGHPSQIDLSFLNKFNASVETHNAVMAHVFETHAEAATEAEAYR